MSIPNIVNNVIQPTNIVFNQVPVPHGIMTNITSTNGIPIRTALAHGPVPIEQMTETKAGIIVQGIPIVGVSNIPVQTINPARLLHSNTNSFENISQLLTRNKLNELVKFTDPYLLLEEDVEEALLVYTDDLVKQIYEGAITIAKHRHFNTIDVKDVQQFLGRNYGIWAPGFGTDELRPYKRKLRSESHKQRLALIRKA